MTTEHAESMAAGLEQLAAFVRANPELGERLRFALKTIAEPICNSDDPKALMTKFVRAGKSAGAHVVKDIDPSQRKYAAVYLEFGSMVRVQVYAEAEQVCERVVVGTHTEEVEVPDPEALAAVPTVKTEKVVEDYEWRCHPILATGAVKAVA